MDYDLESIVIRNDEVPEAPYNYDPSSHYRAKDCIE